MPNCDLATELLPSDRTIGKFPCIINLGQDLVLIFTPLAMTTSKFEPVQCYKLYVQKSNRGFLFSATTTMTTTTTAAATEEITSKLHAEYNFKLRANSSFSSDDHHDDHHDDHNDNNNYGGGYGGDHQ